ncbi:MAG TPA: hypothetical protein VGN12_22240 [Pirellulales bacterium]
MSGGRQSERVVAALRCLRTCNQFFEFDDQERVVKVAVYRAKNADEIAAHVGQLRDVRNLIFDGTDISDKGVAALQNLSEVRELSLQSPNVTAAGLSCLVGMKKLEHLALDSPGFGRPELDTISRIQSLKELEICGGVYCDADVAPLADLISLEELGTAENERVTGTYARFLTPLEHLLRLSPGEWVTDEGVSCISRLSTLEKLFLVGPYSSLALKQVSQLHNLQTLFITSDCVTDADIAVLADLPKLTWLGLRTPRLTDAGALLLRHCRGLRYLGIFRSALTQTGMKMLQESMPDCNLQLVEGRPSDDESC